MTLIANVLLALVAALHLYFLVLEMFLWTKPLGLKTFRLTPEFAQASKALAANQGLYNGFLAAGLLWGLSQGATGHAVQLFFLGCVVVASDPKPGSRRMKMLFGWIVSPPLRRPMISLTSAYFRNTSS